MELAQILKGASWVELAATILVVLIATLYLLRWTYRFFFSNDSRHESDGIILLLGPCGSGKTSLFYLWSRSDSGSQKPLLTVTSQSVNRGHVLPENLEVVDYPGHPRLWHGALSLVPRAHKIVFLIDATSNINTLKLVAESIYDVLVVKELSPSTRVLICRNKTDLKSAISQEDLVATLNKQIETLRKSRAQELEGDNAADQFLGFDDEPFDLTLHSPISIEFGACSVRKGKIGDIERFLRYRS